MKFGKKLERLLLAEMGVCLIVLLLSMSGRCSSMAILLSTLFQIFMIIYIIVVLVHPLQAYARILEHLNKTEFEREELRMAPAGVPFVKETYSLLDRYAAYKTRKNNAQILNKQTELTALQSQINPHFLYNTLADKVFFVPAAVYRGTDDVVPSFQPMGNLFEQCLLILFDIIIMTIVDETPGLTFEKMSKNHRNVE